MKNNQRQFICVAAIGLSLCLAQPLLAQAIAQRVALTGHPDMSEGFNSRPVVVTSVATEALTSTITAVRLDNISSKEVTGVRLGWVLMANGTTVSSGKTGLVPTKNFSPGTSIVVKLPVISLADLKPELSAKGIAGNISAVISVADILFSDESTWKSGDKTAVEKLPF